MIERDARIFAKTAFMLDPCLFPVILDLAPIAFMENVLKTVG